jgi:O-antigen/teichoic acid export membrane protein
MARKAEKNHLDDSLKKIARGAGVVLVGTLIGTAIGYLSRLIIARSLGPAPYGLISLAFAGFSIAATFGALGLPGGVVRHVSLFKGKGDRTRIKGAITSGLKIAIPLSLGLGILLFLGSGWLSVHVFHDARLAPLLKVMSVAVPFWAAMNVLLGGVRGFQRMEYHVYAMRIVEPVSRTVLIAALVLLGYGVLGAAIAYVFAAALAALAAFYFLQRKVFPFVRSKIKSASMSRELLAYSWPLLFSGILLLVTNWTDTLMLGFFKTSTDVGFYNAALPTVRVFSAVPIAFGMIFFPVLSELYGRGRRREMGEIFTTTTKWVFMILLPIALLMILFSEAVLRILFGPAYVVASAALSILTVGFLINYLFLTSRSMISVVGKTKLIALISAVTAGANVGLNYLLIPPYGISGAALATGISVAAGGVLAGVLAVRVTKLRPFNLNYPKTLASGLIAAASIFLLYQGASSLLGKSILLLVGMFVAFVLIYFLMSLVFRCFDRNDVMIMKAVEQKAGVRLELLRKLIGRFM